MARYFFQAQNWTIIDPRREMESLKVMMQN